MLKMKQDELDLMHTTAGYNMEMGIAGLEADATRNMRVLDMTQKMIETHKQRTAAVRAAQGNAGREDVVASTVKLIAPDADPEAAISALVMGARIGKDGEDLLRLANQIQSAEEMTPSIWDPVSARVAQEKAAALRQEFAAKARSLDAHTRHAIETMLDGGGDAIGLVPALNDLALAEKETPELVNNPTYAAKKQELAQATMAVQTAVAKKKKLKAVGEAGVPMDAQAVGNVVQELSLARSEEAAARKRCQELRRELGVISEQVQQPQGPKAVSKLQSRVAKASQLWRESFGGKSQVDDMLEGQMADMIDLTRELGKARMLQLDHIREMGRSLVRSGLRNRPEGMRTYESMIEARERARASRPAAPSGVGGR